MELQLQCTRGCRDPVVDQCPRHRHKLPRDELDGLLRAGGEGAGVMSLMASCVRGEGGTVTGGGKGNRAAVKG